MFTAVTPREATPGRKWGLPTRAAISSVAERYQVTGTASDLAPEHLSAELSGGGRRDKEKPRRSGAKARTRHSGQFILSRIGRPPLTSDRCLTTATPRQTAERRKEGIGCRLPSSCLRDCYRNPKEQLSRACAARPHTRA